jgi:hypothetical protein
MAIPPPGVDQAALTVAARRVLLDGISALHEHVQALVLIGAQAVYLRSQSTNLGVATATSDGDLSLDPELLRPDPRIEAALTDAGFTRDIDSRQPQPGTWFRTVDVNGSPVPIPVDLLAPETLIPSAGRRGVRIPPHDRSAVRRVPGIEVSVEDHDLMEVHSLEPQVDPRVVSIRVAGPAALMVAKAFKIRDRVASGKPERLSNKDASDVYRLMLATDPYEVADSFERLVTSPRVGQVAREGLELLVKQFGVPQGVGVTMAVQALNTAVAPDEISRTAPAFVAALPSLDTD